MYKRQIQDIERLVGALADIKRLYAKNPEQMPNAEYIKPTVCVSPQTAFYGEKKSVPIRETEGTVSYTHLDVYKRQV